ncbi:MAG TPA: DUF6036 family nucleotidyltransferase [Gemmatimonadales bacterium]|nr:DUF6036 family nucleotidyltransferase [Gemmatimonadales bacterium]
MHNVLQGSSDIRRALERVGELLDAAGEMYAIIIVGGAAMNLRNVVSRATTDVDVIAFATRRAGSWRPIEAPPQLPAPLALAVTTVARDLNLVPDWLNTGPRQQWKFGLAHGFAARVRWRRYGGLHVGTAGRADLIALKLFAATDADGPAAGRHTNDLQALRPTDRELATAARWVKQQDAGALFPQHVDQVVERVRARRAQR